MAIGQRDTSLTVGNSSQGVLRPKNFGGIRCPRSMSITPELRASARSAYRCLLRAASSTFKNDQRVLRAFRDKIRTDAQGAQCVTDPVTYAGKTQLGREIADILRRNVVQGVHVEEPSSSVTQDSQGERWKLRYTEHTELGSNEDRFGPTSTASSSSSTGGCCQDGSSGSPNTKSTSQPSL